MTRMMPSPGRSRRSADASDGDSASAPLRRPRKRPGPLEVLYVAFIFIGMIKAAPIAQTAQAVIDLTLAVSAVLLLGTWIFVATNRAPISSAPQARRYLTLFACLALLIVLAGTLASPSEDASRKIYRFLLFNSAAVLPPLVYLTRPDRLRRLLTLSLVVAAVGTAVSLVLVGGGAGVGVLGSASYQALGETAGIGFVIALTRLSLAGRANSISVLLLGLFAFGIVASGTRHALLGALAAVALVVIKRSSRTSSLRTFMLLVLGAVLAIGLSTLFMDLDPIARSQRRLSDTFESVLDRNLGGEIRVDIWKTAARAFADNPITGIGIGSFKPLSPLGSFRHPHNIFLELGIELGALGLAVGVALLYQPLSMIWKLPAKTAGEMSVDGLLAFYLAAALVSGDLADNRMLFGVGALVLASRFPVNRQMPPPRADRSDSPIDASR